MSTHSLFSITPTIAVHDSGLADQPLSPRMLQKGRDIRVLLLTKAVREGAPPEFEETLESLLRKALNENHDLTDDERSEFERKLYEYELAQHVQAVLQTPMTIVDMQMVIPGVFISSAMAAFDKNILRDEKITHICMCLAGKPPFPDSFDYLVINVVDVDNEDIKSHFRKGIDFITEARKNPDSKVLIHCQAGVSRSCSVLMAFLMYELHISATQALALVRAARPFVRPNDGFAKQLLEFECEIFEDKGFHRMSE